VDQLRSDGAEGMDHRLYFRAALAVLAILFISSPLTVRAEKFQYDVQVLYYTPDNWLVIAQEGQQVAQKFRVVLYVNRPCRVDIDIVVGGESEFKTSIPVEFKWEREHVTTKSAQPVSVRFTFHFDDTIMETEWNGLIVKAPQPYPKNLEEWFSPKQVERMISNLTFENIFKALIYSIVGVGMAIISRYYFLLLSPLNGVHASMIVGSLYASMSIDPNWGVSYWLITLISDIVVYQFIKSARLMSILVYDLPKKNFDLVGIPYYHNSEGKLCAALQSTVFAIRRTLFNQHVVFRFKNEYLPKDKQEKLLSIKPTHTLNQVEPLYLADKAGVQELVEYVEREEQGGGIIGTVTSLLPQRRKKRRNWYFDVYPSECGIPFDNFTLGFDMDAISKLKKWAVDLAVENAELKQLLDAKSIQKGQEIAKKHLDAIQEVIGLTEVETSV